MAKEKAATATKAKEPATQQKAQQKSQASQQRGPKKARRNVFSGKVYIIATFNNTLVYITDIEGNTLGWQTAGGKGFKGSRKSTPYAAQIAAKGVAETVKANCNMKEVAIYIKGAGPGREAAAKAIGEYFKPTIVSDITGLPHNGCRPEKERRI